MLHRFAAGTRRALATALAVLSLSQGALAQTPLGSAFTYQGRLTTAAGAVGGSCDLNFGLFAAASGGAALGTQPKTAVPVSAGLFTVELDFGPAAFGGSERWLEVAMRCPAGGGSFTTLSPRQRLAAAPYALWTAAAGSVPATGITGAITVTNGNVGIGTTNPIRGLQVSGPQGSFGAELILENTGMPVDHRKLDVWGNSGAGAQGIWQLRALNDAGDASTKDFMTFDNATGNVGIGRNPATNRLEVEGEASKMTSGSWAMNSDGRLKTDIRDIGDALGVIGTLRPVQFRYTDAFREKHPGVKDKTYYSYVAQEFQQVFPDSVTAGEDGYLQIDIHNTNVYAVRAVQELHRIVKEKETEIAEQKARLQTLETRLRALEETLRSTAVMAPPSDRGSRP